LALIAVSVRARAHDREECGDRGVPWVQLDRVPFDAVFRLRLVAQLQAGLAERHLELCGPHDAGSLPVATCDISLADADAPSVTVVLRDAITAKQVSRDLDLSTIPRDARPLTVALAIDELLRASWIELSLRDAPASGRPVPPAISAVVAESSLAMVPAIRDPASPGPPPAEIAARAWQLGAGLSAEHLGGGTEMLGIDVTGRYAPLPPLGFHVRFGFRSIPAAFVPDGIVTSTAVRLDLGTEVALLPPAARLGLALLARGSLAHVSFVGEPVEGATGTEVSATAFYMSLGAEASFRVTRSFGMALGLAWGAPLHPIYVLDRGSRVAGISGSLVSSNLGAWWRFP
jgi:hypothetical protein